MAFTLKIAFILYCVYSLADLVSGNVDGNPFQITRRRRDEFKNLNCKNGSTNCTTECRKYNATCIDTKECHFCRCNESMGTFIRSGCKKDEDIIPESAPKKSFKLINTVYNKCLTVDEERNNTLAGTNCSSSLNMRWIFIKTVRPETDSSSFKLINVGTLQCLQLCTADSTATEGKVTINPCRGERDGQKIQRSNRYIFSECGPSYYLNFLKLQGGDERYLAASKTGQSQDWWRNANSGLHLKAETYNGCYRFMKPNRFMLYLSNKTCRDDPCYHQFYAPILFQCETCSILWQNSYILNSTAMDWSALPESINQSLISLQKVENDEVKNLKIAQDALEEFSGSLLKLSVSCKSKNGDESHCLLLKFESLKKYIKTTTAATVTTTTSIKQTTTTTTKPSAKTTSNAAVGSTKRTTSAVPSTTKKSTHKDTEESSISTLAIVVPVSLLVVILVLTLVYFMCCRKRKRDSKLSNAQGHGNLNNPNYSKAVYADPNTAYETLALSDQEAKPPRYEYIDNNQIVQPKQPAQPELKYDYATNTEIPRVNSGVTPVSQSATNPPELKYDYAANTEIPRIKLDANPPASQNATNPPELKYDYAANTEIPRIKLDANPPASQGATDPAELKYDYAANTDIPKVKLDTNPPVSKDPTNPAEFKYDYAINTETPRIKLDTQPKPEDTAEPSNTNTYHTLEEPKQPEANMYHTLEEPNPSQSAVYHTLEEPEPAEPAVYSTLEKPETEAKPLVTYDTPHSGDPVYNVLEKSNDTNSQYPTASTS